MDFVIGTNNYIMVNHAHIFANFTSGNMEMVRKIDPRTNPTFHIFVHDITIEDDNDALISLSRWCASSESSHSSPIAMTLYSPMRYTKLRKWLEDLQRNNEWLKNIVFTGNYFTLPLVSPGQAFDQRLIVEYIAIDEVHEMVFGYDSYRDDRYTELARYQIKPNLDWIKSGKPGHR